MVILANLSYFGPIFLVRNENCVATLLIANLPIPENWSNLEISKILSYPPSDSRGRLIDVQIFSLAQIGKILKNQTDPFLALGKLNSSLM